ncbi:MAG: diguanylate cyclase [Pseudomonadota bacterium]
MRKLLHFLLHFLLGAEPRLRRLTAYWIAAGLFYLLSMVLLNAQVRIGTASAEGAFVLTWFAAIGVLVFFILVRGSTALGIPPWQLAVSQAMFAILCDIGAYAVMGPVRGASLTVLLVIIVFCTFSLRPRATLALSAFAVATLGLTMAWMVAHDPQRYPAKVELVHFAIASCSLLAVAILIGEMSKMRSSMKRQREELMTALGKIQILATVDELTSLANRRYMNEVLSAEERRGHKPGEKMCIALLDIDFFKSVNDHFGHAGGDTVLRNFAAAARTQLRAVDVLARWGGEEFLLLLPDTGLDEAEAALERMADAVKAIKIPEFDLQRTITFSAGLVERQAGEPFAETISRADRAMYKAKAAGRNMVVRA